ncbi:MAG TPA: hypothetical protein VFY89_01045, partial [Ktedonobacterales bacterium]
MSMRPSSSPGEPHRPVAASPEAARAIPRALRGWGGLGALAPLVIIPLALMLLALAALGWPRALGMADLSARAAGYEATPTSTPPARFAAPPGTPATPTLPAACTAGNRYAFAHDLIIPASEWICGRATALGGGVTVLGRVGGDVVVIGGRATIAGEVDGSVTAVGGSVTLLQGAKVGGSVQAYGGSVQTRGTVQVGGHIQRDAFVAVPGPVQWPFFVPGLSALVPRLIFWALAGALVAHFLPAHLRRVALVMRGQPVVSAFLGAGGTIAALAISILLVITCLGIPVALVLLFGLWVAWVVGTVAAGLWLGEALLRVALPRERGTVLLPA